MVKLSTVWTVAEATAGLMPRLSSSVFEMTPNAMPSAPSTSCAAKPIRMKGRRSTKVKLVKSIKTDGSGADWGFFVDTSP